MIWKPKWPTSEDKKNLSSGTIAAVEWLLIEAYANENAWADKAIKYQKLCNRWLIAAYVSFVLNVCLITALVIK